MTQGMSAQHQTQTGTVPSMRKNNRSSLWVLLKGRMVYNVHVWLCDGHMHTYIVDEYYSDSDSNNSMHLAVDMVTGDGGYVCVYSPLSEQALASEYAEPSPPGRHPPHFHSCSGQWW